MKKAFTLIELLVVIAIIAILAAILFPVFAQAKAAAKKAANLSNQKQVGTALMIYLNDSDDVYPPANDTNWDQWPLTPWSSSVVLGPYIKNGDLWAGPGDSLPDPMISAPTSQRIPYRMSFLPNALADKGDHPWGITNAQGVFSFGGYNGGAMAEVSSTQVTSIADVVMMIDGRKEFVGDYWGCPWSLTTEGDYCYDWGNYRSVLSATWEIYSLSKAVPEDGALYKAWHKQGSGVNATFTDGHAKTVQAGSLYDAKYWLVNAGQ